MKKIILIVVIIALVIFGIYYFNSVKKEKITEISSFEECVEAGYPVMESYPRKCQVPEGDLFSEYIGNEFEKVDFIFINNPRPNQEISSPLNISGEARGYWYFEADFPIELLDEDGNVIGTAIASAKDDWMTEDFVEFEAVLEFEKPESQKGTLILKKDNPSGLSENDDELIVPVKFN
jgi:hypothetical protein